MVRRVGWLSLGERVPGNRGECGRCRALVSSCLPDDAWLAALVRVAYRNRMAGPVPQGPAFPCVCVEYAIDPTWRENAPARDCTCAKQTSPLHCSRLVGEQGRLLLVSSVGRNTRTRSLRSRR